MMLAIALVLLVSLSSDIDVALSFDRACKQFSIQTGINDAPDVK